ncbi:hypothetical protein PVMG_06200 [Plasmodium vivax Mauritania I]|uniref:PIR Superfamily Protein n=3 Tax=Plasmodium vivax TaxID=5855 RepID=A0A0J9TJT8_PLAVI|nr:hypothetical protein PVBG_05038 [Plasmodium vivax Brazil I]KMZ95022.1 hypothetical protein PVMG_06200 [Plasmodium vivax Mauritania I]
MCSKRPNEESYEFFENIEDYIKKAKSAEDTSTLPNSESKCNDFMRASGSYFTDRETAEIICKQFIKLYVSLDNVNCVQNRDPTLKKCSEFLNYWINFKFRESMKNEDDCVPDVYDHLEVQFTGDDDFKMSISNIYIYDMNNDDLYKMNILYSLYQNYSKLKNIIENKSGSEKPSLLPHSTACCADYIEAKYICNGDNNDENIFCEKLKNFQTKYDALYQNFDGKRSQFSDNLLKLEECPNPKIITTAVTGSIIGLIPLLGVLYKVSKLNIKL